MRSSPSRTQLCDRTPLSGGTFAYSTFCHALSVALARATIRSLKPKLTPATSSEARNNGASTWRSEEHTSELQSLMRISYAVFCLKKKTQKNTQLHTRTTTAYTIIK